MVIQQWGTAAVATPETADETWYLRQRERDRGREREREREGEGGRWEWCQGLLGQADLQMRSCCDGLSCVAHQLVVLQ